MVQAKEKFLEIFKLDGNMDVDKGKIDWERALKDLVIVGSTERNKL
jgi:hypothetical protein